MRLWDGIELARPEALWLLGGVLALCAWRLRRRPPAVALGTAPLLLGRPLPGEAAPAPRAPRAPRAGAWRLGEGLGALGLAALVLALARPVERVVVPEPRPGIDILLALDRSSSMRAADLGGASTRLEAAQEAAVRFVTGRRDDRIGVLGFARFADLLCPLTLDHGAVVRTLAGLEPVPVDDAEDATALGAALAQGALLLGANAGRPRVLILLSDGRETAAPEARAGEVHPLHAAQLCARLGVRVLAIAVGAEDPAPGGDAAAPLGPTLAQVAARAGGAFHRVRDEAALDAVYARVDRLERAALLAPRREVRERQGPVLLASLGLLLLGWGLSQGLLRVLP